MTTVQVAGLAARVEAVRERIERACARGGRDPAGVTLVAASKTQPAAVMAAAFRAGVRDFGENRLQEALAKMPAVEEVLSRDEVPRWHFIGHLQTNKAKAAARAFAILHGVDSPRLLDALAAAGCPVRLLLEVNVAGEATKHGVPPEEVPVLLEHASRYPMLAVEGLMTVAPLAANSEEARPVFRRLHALAEQHRLPLLSMGMTDDFEVAIEEGSTHVRVGRAIFGERQP